LVPETAEVLISFDDPYWHFSTMPRNGYGSGSLTYEGTFLTDTSQREVIRDVLNWAGLANGSESGVCSQGSARAKLPGQVLNYYLNFSGEEQSVPYAYANGQDLLTSSSWKQGQVMKIKRWDLAIVAEQ
jgi:beta-galactosidase